MSYAIRFNGGQFGLSINPETGGDEWCANASQLTRFDTKKQAQEAMVKFKLRDDLYSIIDHPIKRKTKGLKSMPKLNL